MQSLPGREQAFAASFLVNETIWVLTRMHLLPCSAADSFVDIASQVSTLSQLVCSDPRFSHRTAFLLQGVLAFAQWRMRRVDSKVASVLCTWVHQVACIDAESHDEQPPFDRYTVALQHPTWYQSLPEMIHNMWPCSFLWVAPDWKQWLSLCWSSESPLELWLMVLHTVSFLRTFSPPLQSPSALSCFWHWSCQPGHSYPCPVAQQ